MRTKRKIEKIVALLLLCCLLTAQHIAAQEIDISKSQMTEDLLYLKSELLQKHPNLYTYTQPEMVDNFFKDIMADLPESISSQSAYLLVSSISAMIRDGHSYVYPSQSHLDQFYTSAPLFPFDLFLDRDRLYVIADHSDEQQMPIGAKLLSINNIRTDEIMETIIGHVARDGYNLGYAEHLAYEFFPAYFSFFYGRQDRFDIKYQHGNEIKTIQAKGQVRPVIKKRRMAKQSAVNSKPAAIATTFYPSDKLAVLTIQSFDNDLLKKDYGLKFKTEIKEAFASIAEQDIDYLAIDLRGNQGGALDNGVYLLQQFMRTSFQCVYAYHKVKWDKKTQTRKMQRINNKWDDFFEPTSNAFQGEVFLICDGGSFSCSAIVANAFKESKRGKVIGTMTGGSAYFNSGGPTEVVSLPNSKVTFSLPITQYQLRKQTENIGAGVIPDRVVSQQVNLLIEGRDPCLEQIIKEIKVLEKPD